MQGFAGYLRLDNLLIQCPVSNQERRDEIWLNVRDSKR